MLLQRHHLTSATKKLLNTLEDKLGDRLYVMIPSSLTNLLIGFFSIIITRCLLVAKDIRIVVLNYFSHHKTRWIS